MNRTDALKQTKKFWNNFYAKNRQNKPSPFAIWSIDNYIHKDDNIFEIGCGDGRDSFAFVANNNSILAIDGCEVAIEYNNKQLQKLSYKPNALFKAIDFTNLNTLNTNFKFTLCYSRFVLHAIPEDLEDILLEYIYKNLPRGGKMIHEFRTNHDKLMQQGEQLSQSERLTDHYRRFINTKLFREKLLKLGFKELFFLESNNLAPYKDENPVVARIVVEKV